MLHRCARSSTISAEFGAIDSMKNRITTLETFLSVTAWAPFSSFVSFPNFGPERHEMHNLRPTEITDEPS